MKTVTYITENTVMKFLYNPKKTFLEGFAKEWLRFDSGTYQDYGKYVRFLKFVDFDTKEILGASPYWRSDVMKNEFKKVSSPQERHDYVVYKMHEDILNQRYHESIQTILAELKKVIPRIELTGQWSVDVMRNGNDYYIIDMALAENSALNDCVPSNRLRAYPQQWLPVAPNTET